MSDKKKTAQNISVNVNAKNLDVGNNATMSKEEAIEFAKSIIYSAAELRPAKTVAAEIVLSTEGSAHDPVQKVKIKLVMDGKTIVKNAHSRSIKNALERAQNDLESQVRKIKEKKLEGRQRYRKAATKNRINQRMMAQSGQAQREYDKMIGVTDAADVEYEE